MIQGVITEIRGFVLKIEFDDQLPMINDVLAIELDPPARLLVQKISSDRIAVALNLDADIRLEKNMTVISTEQTLELPVGEELIGRVLDSLGRPIDGGSDYYHDGMTKKPIFANPKHSDFLGSENQILETGIKQIAELLLPFMPKTAQLILTQVAKPFEVENQVIFVKID